MRILLGAEYQDLKSAMIGSIDLGGENLDFEIGIESEKWAGMLGIHKELGSQFETSLLFGYGPDRESITLNIGYRL